jgi:Tfp pilus assembly protein PilF
MRLMPRFLMAGAAVLMLAAPVSGQKADDQIDPRSIELLRQGEALLSTGKLVEADDALESALAVDPRNREAYIVMARVAQKQKLFGQAIRFTNKALTLEPNDRKALALQGEAMVELGATARARGNLEKLKTLCQGGCPELASLSAAISRGPTVAQAKAPPAPKTN